MGLCIGLSIEQGIVWGFGGTGFDQEQWVGKGDSGHLCDICLLPSCSGPQELDLKTDRQGWFEACPGG